MLSDQTQMFMGQGFHSVAAKGTYDSPHMLLLLRAAVSTAVL